MERLKFLRMKAVSEITGLSRSYIYKLMQENRFPKSFRLVAGSRAVAWNESDIQDWMNTKIQHNQDEEVL